MAQKGYKIRGIAPSDVADYPTSVRKLYWEWVVEFGLKRKDKELSQGLDKDGDPMRPIKQATREHRHSAMTPSGRGDPAAPPLEPGWQKSRTRSLLAGRALSSHAEFYWRYDAYTGGTWAVILGYQAEQGRDVFGLSPEGTRWVEEQARKRWEAWKAGRYRLPAKPAQPAPEPIRAVGRTDERFLVRGANVGAVGPNAGYMTVKEWQAHFRETAQVSIPGREARPASKSPVVGPDYNRLLGHVWTPKITPPSPKQPVVVPPPKAPKPPKPLVARVTVAMPPKPAPAPSKPVRQPGQPIEPRKPIGERIKLASHTQAKLDEVLSVTDAGVLRLRQLESERRELRKQLEAFNARLKEAGLSPDSNAELADLNARYKASWDQIVAHQASTRYDVARVLQAAPTDRQAWNHRDERGNWAVTTPMYQNRDAARSWLEQMVAGKGNPPVEINWVSKDGARASSDSISKRITVGWADGSGTHVHEMGHQLEDSVPGAREAAREFLAHRVGGQPLRKMKDVSPQGNYRDDEMGRDDDFGKAFGEKPSWYVGKHYDHGGTEIISMGVEKLYNDPALFARQDPEFFRFIVGILDGSLRKP